MQNFFKSLLFILLNVAANFAEAQVPKKAIVEHFTNSNCGVCAGNNPGIRTTINGFGANVLHLSFYPSSPYSTCFFSMQNAIENDARTNFYGLYGGTPQLAMNGVSIARQNLNAGLATAVTQTTNFAINSRQRRLTTDSVAVTVVIKKVSSGTNTSALLFVGVAEDTIARTTGNGETMHYDVFRKALTNVVGNAITLPAAVGDSLVFNYRYKALAAWNQQRLNVITILQNTNKTLINAAKSPDIVNFTSTENLAIQEKNIFYPNPSNGILYLDNADDFKTIYKNDFKTLRIFDSFGKMIYTNNNLPNSIDISNFANGIYILQIENGAQVYSQKIVKM